MTINELRNTVFLLANQYTFGDFSPEQFNSALALANEEYFNNELGVFSMDQEKTDNLNVLKKRISVNLNTHGQAIKPSDYAYGLAIRLASGPQQKEVEVEILSDSEWANRSSSPLISTSEYPIARIDNTLIQTLGVTDNRIILYYLRQPIVPVWAYNLVSVPGSVYGRPAYDASNTVESDFQNTPTAMREILFKTTQFLGMNIQRQDLVQYSVAKE